MLEKLHGIKKEDVVDYFNRKLMWQGKDRNAMVISITSQKHSEVFKMKRLQTQYYRVYDKLVPAAAPVIGRALRTGIASIVHPKRP